MNPVQRKIRLIAAAAVLTMLPAGVFAAEDSAAHSLPGGTPAHAIPTSKALGRQPVILDRVVAAVNGDVILSSDVQEEIRFSRLQPGRANPERNTAQRALRRLIDRELILQQMKARQVEITPPTDQQVEKQLAELRKQLPQCAQFHCATEAGWKAFLASDGLTEKEVKSRWRERMIILSFIQSRFGAGVRISPQQIEDYYQKNFVPEFTRRKLSAPALETVSKRIDEILLQERVNELLRDWLESLKQEGSVKILYPQPNPGGAAAESASESQP